MGKHYLINLYDCPYHLLDDVEFIVQLLRDAAIICNATILDTSYHHFKPEGVTAFVMLAESHISIHTWPEKGSAACDVYTCSETDPRVGCDLIIGRLCAQNHKLTYIER
jgi:S-adenosylmethionine decarboxylase